ncbi:hypothetical protein BK675_20775 [Pseudomonas fluorescens]|jgi:hypothetical protein|uniref:glycine-rich domain-containing protein n=1 Tax=Pseudomonas atacamensis TaxID=2565368 RepID=UPI000F4A4CE5|nr:hypothetical protein [Pseudomonas atacamensis]QSL86769.1 hypothetical protein JWU58_21725 [Pseudomonas atacamensis]RON73154.1 hypothetical protein BK677_12770 [Pseudomonas fluorescens]ROO05268.1 hypothetical protein BK675_20775 [Pseudomonas fluorescens]ROO21321.1 hypothetical protein BK676_02485 [Pseudomonas fluorescens]
MDYPKNIPGVGLVNGGFVDENPLAGTPGSLIPAAWGNSVTQEILNAIKAAGLTPDEARTDQLASAIGALVDFNKLKNTPTTLAGYGITDAVGRLLAVRQFETVGITVYKPNPKAKRIRVRLVGGGGSGGGCAPVASGNLRLGGGGGSGAYAESLYDVTPQMLAGVPVSLGAGGAASPSMGLAGGGASFGSYMSVTGGGGAQILTIDTTTSSSGYVQGGTGGQDAVGGNLANARGHTGGYAMFNGNWGMLSGGGAASPFDGGGPYRGVNNPGFAGVRGSGGSGSCSTSTSASVLSGVGGNAFCEIWEYE